MTKELYFLGVTLIGLPLFLRYSRVAVNSTKDHLHSFWVISLLTVSFWPVALIWFLVEFYSVNFLGDIPEEHRYLFYNDNSESKDLRKD